MEYLCLNESNDFTCVRGGLAQGEKREKRNLASNWMFNGIIESTDSPFACSLSILSKCLCRICEWE